MIYCYLLFLGGTTIYALENNESVSRTDDNILSTNTKSQSINIEIETKKTTLDLTKDDPYRRDAIAKSVSDSNNEDLTGTIKTKPINDISGQMNKKDFAKEISQKVQLLAKQLEKKSFNPETKKKFLTDFKDRILNSAKKQNSNLRNKGETINNYAVLIAEKIDSLIKDYSKNSTRRNFVQYETSQNEDKQDVEKPSNINKHYSATLKHIEAYDNDSCVGVLGKYCKEINDIQAFECLGDVSTISYDRVCDGEIDCPDGSDETNCTGQALYVVRAAGLLIMHLENTDVSKCLMHSVDKAVLSKYSEALSVVLNRQILFIQKYKTDTAPYFDTMDIRKAVKDILAVINTMMLSLNGIICKPRKGSKLKPTKRSSLIELGDDFSAEFSSGWTTRPCVCKEQFCKDLKCPLYCKRVCFNKYALGRWQCQALDGGTHVAFDVVCDKKLDCYDESDETGCRNKGSVAKFESDKLYENILNMISTRTTASAFELVLGRMVHLRAAIKDLQGLTKAKFVEPARVKRVRNECFTIMTEIYNDMLKKAESSQPIEDVYIFLLAINEKLMKALKLSQTGNEQLIPDDRCSCLNGKCILAQCNVKCARACEVESRFTKYTCQSTPKEAVSLLSICDGTVDCPNGDDERQCRDDVCRKHHLLLLRREIESTGAGKDGTSLGEQLKAWRTKVMSALKIAELSPDRPTPAIIKEIVSYMVQDLTMAYSTFNFSRRASGNSSLTSCIAISQSLMEIIKSCGQ